jgi:uncharacterized membrane protein HdeD (DUF308 family)
MSESETPSVVDGTPSSVSELTQGIWWWVLVRGIIAIIFGVITLLSPASAILALALVFGVYALIDGVVAIAHAVRVRTSFPKWGWLIVQGVLSALAGLAALILPGLVGVLGALVLLWTIVIWNVMHGVSGIYSASGAASGSAKAWGIVAGVLSVIFGIVLGILLLVTPAAAIFGFVWLVGVYAIAFGVMLAVTAIQVRVTGTPTGAVTA